MLCAAEITYATHGRNQDWVSTRTGESTKARYRKTAGWERKQQQSKGSEKRSSSSISHLVSTA